MIVDDSIPISNTTLSDVEKYSLHRIADRLRLFPYTDMVQWVVDNISITDRKIIKINHTVIGYFTNEDL